MKIRALGLLAAATLAMPLVASAYGAPCYDMYVCGVLQQYGVQPYYMSNSLTVYGSTIYSNPQIVNTSYAQSYQMPQYQQPYMQQSQTQHPSYGAQNYYQPSYSNGYSYQQPSSRYGNVVNNEPVYPYAYATPTPYSDAFGTKLCRWSDFPTLAPCDSNPNQWIFDPYTETWY